MPEVTIKYKKPETLKILKGLARYLDFQVANGSKKKRSFDDIIIPGDKNADISALQEVFTGKNIDAKKLREELWKRNK